jgi:hypothetical protein
MKFRDLACDHLAQYKVNVLGIAQDGIFKYRGQDLSKRHILPIAQRDLNILERFRAQFWASESSKFKLHQFFHHLNSSQALCINLFYPLIAENLIGLFLQSLGMAPEAVACAIFEKESDIELAARRTSFDFFVQLNGGQDIFVEVKYTEEGFAKADCDKEHLAKFQETYLPLIENSPFLAPRCREARFFLDHYQVLRNLVHISETGIVVFLFPSANTDVAEQAVFARDHLLTNAGRNRLRIVFLDEFVAFLEVTCAGGPLDGYYQAFRTKYLPPDQTAIDPTPTQTLSENSIASTSG